MKLKLLQIGFFLAIQAPALLLAQPREDDSTPEISISIEDGKVKLAVNLNEPFRWEKTRRVIYKGKFIIVDCKFICIM